MKTIWWRGALVVYSLCVLAEPARAKPSVFEQLEISIDGLKTVQVSLKKYGEDPIAYEMRLSDSESARLKALLDDTAFLSASPPSPSEVDRLIEWPLEMEIIVDGQRRTLSEGAERLQPLADYFRLMIHQAILMHQFRQPSERVGALHNIVDAVAGWSAGPKILQPIS